MKPNKLFIFSFLFLLSFSLALATTIETNEVYASGAIVTVTGTCDTANAWVGLEYGFGTPIKTISVDQVNSDSSKKYFADYLPPQSGTYTVWAACQGESNVFTSFCVGAGCTTTPEDIPPIITPPATPGGSSGGGGGSSTKWECNPYWSFCAANLTQSRTCFDQRNNKKTKVVFRECKPCNESRICSLWDDCESGFETRSCIDEHYCGTNVLIPIEQKSCGIDFVSGSDPAKITPPGVQLPASIEPSIWDQYKWHFFWLLIIILLIVLGIFIYLHFFHNKKKAYNIEELKTWVKQEKAAGTTNEDIRHILIKNTGWTDEEIDTAFVSLRKTIA